MGKSECGSGLKQQKNKNGKLGKREAFSARWSLVKLDLLCSRLCEVAMLR